MLVKKKLLFVLIIVQSFLLFSPLLSVYFSQDDFFILEISHVIKVSDFFHFFIPRPDVQFYRPLGSETFFWLGRSIFGWNAPAFHLFLWPFFIFSIFLVYKISKKILKSSRGGLIILLLYGTSAVHYNTLSWLANSSYSIGAFLFFLCFYIFIYFKPSSVRTFSLCFIFLLALLTNEFTFLLPFVLFIFELLTKGKNSLKLGKRLFVSLGIIMLGYGMLRSVFRSDLASYPVSLNQSIISSYRFFLLYFLNWPEAVKDNFLKYWMIRPEFVNTFHTETAVWMLNTVSVFAVALFPLFILFKKHMIHKRDYVTILFLLFWLLISLSPIVIIPSHIAPHHGSISLLPFLILIFYPVIKISLKSLKYQIICLFAILIWVYASIITVKFDQDNHWIKRRADIAKYWIGEADKKRDIIQSSNKVVINKDDKEIQVALFDEKAFREYFNNSGLTVVYQKESSGSTLYSPILLK